MISQPGDACEREADRIADQVMRTNISSVANIAEQKSAPVTRSAEKNGSTPAEASDVLRGGGQPLDRETRSFFEPRFGADFSGVRVHAGAKANALSNRFAARAFTYGNNIVFADGEYRPDSSGGRRLLAHELTHVVQQSGGNKTGNTETRISGQTGNMIQRTPGIDAEDSWNVVVDNFVMPGSAERDQAAIEAKGRMLRTTSGGRLINSLWNLFCGGGRSTCRSHISVIFTTRLPAETTDASGYFQPSSPNQPRYNVWVLSRLPRQPDERGITIGGSWPPAGETLITFTHGDPESSMASTLYHEMLHVWFVHAGRQDIGYPTGHDDVTEGEIEPQFLGLLRGFTRELDTLERRIHQEAAEQRRAPPESRPEVRPESPPSPEPEPRRRPEPSIVGGSVFLRGGGFGGGPDQGGGVGIVGADLVLGRIASFNVGARGIYLTPQHLLAGGALGFRLLQGTQDFGSRVENPMFFDLEAGVLAELPVGDAARLTGDAQFLLSAGFGQEIGRQGPRFFWRVGGFVLISDEGGALGGGTAGGGVRF